LVAGHCLTRRPLCSFFIEKNLFGHFLKIMRIQGNVYVKIQLLQCLNIIFENLRNDSSLCTLLHSTPPARNACMH
jgi:hypothetical protein